MPVIQKMVCPAPLAPYTGCLSYLLHAAWGGEGERGRQVGYVVGSPASPPPPCPLFRRPRTPLATVVDSHALSVKPISVKQGGRNGGPLIHGGSPPTPAQPVRGREGPLIPGTRRSSSSSASSDLPIRRITWLGPACPPCHPTRWYEARHIVASIRRHAGRE